MSRIVVTVHGVETSGLWQKQTVPVLARAGYVPHPLDYGRFPFWATALPPRRRQKVDWLKDEFERISEGGKFRPSVIAHSFGTFLLVKMLETYDFVKVDNVILTGAVLRREYDWAPLVDRGQVNRVLNEVGKADMVSGAVRFVGWATGGMGDSGKQGFTRSNDRVVNTLHDFYRHSDVFQTGHARAHWLPFLEGVWPSNDDGQRARGLLDTSRREVASQLGLPEERLRAYVMIPQRASGVFRIPPGLATPLTAFRKDAATNDDEMDLSIPFGAGGHGEAFRARTATISVYEDGWASLPIPTEALHKLNSDLRWGLYAPIPDADDPMGVSMLGILALECIQRPNRPAFTHEDLTAVLPQMREAGAALSQAFQFLA